MLLDGVCSHIAYSIHMYREELFDTLDILRIDRSLLHVSRSLIRIDYSVVCFLSQQLNMVYIVRFRRKTTLQTDNSSLGIGKVLGLYMSHIDHCLDG